MNKYAIIVAGGKGERMGTETPKQFLVVKGKPVLMHTLQAFANADASTSIILVLPEVHVATWENLCEEFAFQVPHAVVAGGEQRFHSVQNGLRAIGDANAWVAIHDGVRPLITTSVIAHVYAEAEKKGNAVAAVKSKDSLRHEINGRNVAVNRDEYYLIQTPQVFEVSALRLAYNAAAHAQFTDDATVIEAAGGKVNLVQGSYRNIKITTPEDLILAEALLVN